MKLDVGWYTADAVTVVDANPPEGTHGGFDPVASVTGPSLIAGTDRQLPLDEVVIDASLLDEVASATANKEGLLLAMFPDDAQTSPTAAPIDRIHLVIGVRKDGSLDFWGDCLGPTSMAAAFRRGVAASGLSSKYPRELDLLGAVLSNEKTPEFAAFSTAVSSKGGPTIADWLARSPDKRTITPKYMPPDVAGSLQAFTLVVGVPLDWTKQGFAFCMKIKLGWEEDCYNADARTQAGGFVMIGQRQLTDDVELWLTREDAGYSTVYTNLGSVTASDLASDTAIVILEPRGNRTVTDLASRPADAPSMVTVTPYKPGSPLPTTSSTG